MAVPPGDCIFKHPIEAQRAEWSDFRRHVSDWERERRLEQHEPSAASD